MRHKYKGRKLGTSYAHTKAMKRSLVKALFLNDRIKTIESRAKEIRGDVDRIITWAKKGDLHSRRLAIGALGNDSELVREIFDKVSQGMFADRKGGYTRIVKLGARKGDNAPMVIMELITEALPKKSKSTTSAKAKAKKVESPKTDKKTSSKTEKKDASVKNEEIVEKEVKETKSSKKETEDNSKSNEPQSKEKVDALTEKTKPAVAPKEQKKEEEPKEQKDNKEEKAKEDTK